ncbi:hypothetical protein [Candidatus Methylacidithermus pantelleriae]|uniref:Uncharacterized protein n=1 Tax=Candidatus Methylacidithermus pantelleriae TaxID=2744239 RepID=A0A8J2FUZ2_9BACT|nr:hypothetical protein [Candidatus Methylacidithermus pantelleriae]CAF0689459.1 hypothetical protein MPNT_10229 [Candidatus Methylacidithermus pantelleriae]
MTKVPTKVWACAYGRRRSPPLRPTCKQSDEACVVVSLAAVGKRLKAADAAPARSGGNQGPPAAFGCENARLGVTGALAVNPRRAKGRQHSSAGVADDLPS